MCLERMSSVVDHRVIRNEGKEKHKQDEDEWEAEENESEGKENEQERSPSPSEASTVKVGCPSVIAAGEGQNIRYSSGSPEIIIYEDPPNYMPSARPHVRGPSGDYVRKENEDSDEQEEEEEPHAYDPEDDEIRFVDEDEGGDE